VTIHPPVRLVGEPKKTKRKRGRKRHPKQSQIAMVIPYYFGQLVEKDWKTMELLEFCV